MFIRCRFRGRPDRPAQRSLIGKDGFCKGMATSSMYPKSPRPPHIGEPEWEWYKPEGSDGEQLELRERTNALVLYHE